MVRILNNILNSKRCSDAVYGKNHGMIQIEKSKNSLRIIFILYPNDYGNQYDFSIWKFNLHAIVRTTVKTVLSMSKLVVSRCMNNNSVRFTFD